MTQPTYCPSPQFQRAQIQPVAFPLSLPLLKSFCTCGECPSNPAMQAHRRDVAEAAIIHPFILKMNYLDQRRVLSSLHLTGAEFMGNLDGVRRQQQNRESADIARRMLWRMEGDAG